MTDFYSRVGSLSVKKETTANVAVIPDKFLLFDDESIKTMYQVEPSMPIAADRTKNQRAIAKTIPAPAGDLKLSIEPLQFGHIINGLYGGVTSGNYLPISGKSGTIAVGDTVTGGTSAKTATVVFVSPENDFILVSSPSGNFTAAETITATSGGTATVTAFNTTVYGHVATLPAAPLPTYSLQLNFQDTAIRYTGVRFHAIDPIAQANNVMVATVKVMAQVQFRHAVVSAITVGGSGTKVIPVDQTHGLVVGDSIKIFRPSTGAFIDLNGSGVKTNTITAISAGVSVSISVLTDSTAVGDLVVLAPQTSSFTIGSELPWIGSSLGQIGADVTTLATSVMEDFTLSVINDFEAKWQAKGSRLVDRFPAALIQKGLSGKGTFKAFYQDEGQFVNKMRANTAQAFRIKALGGAIGSTGINYEVRFTFPNVQFYPFDTNMGKDIVVEQAVPFEVFKGATEGYTARVLIVTTVTSY